MSRSGRKDAHGSYGRTRYERSRIQSRSADAGVLAHCPEQADDIAQRGRQERESVAVVVDRLRRVAEVPTRSAEQG